MAIADKIKTIRKQYKNHAVQIHDRWRTLFHCTQLHPCPTFAQGIEKNWLKSIIAAETNSTHACWLCNIQVYVCTCVLTYLSNSMSLCMWCLYVCILCNVRDKLKSYQEAAMTTRSLVLKSPLTCCPKPMHRAVLRKKKLLIKTNRTFLSLFPFSSSSA